MLAGLNDKQSLPFVKQILTTAPSERDQIHGSVISALGPMEHPELADVILESYPKLDPAVQPKAIEVLTGRKAWSQALLQAVREKKIPATALNVNHVRKILASGDEELAQTVQDVWGIVRTKRDPTREKLITDMRKQLQKTPGDPHRGRLVFHKICGQCHKMHGKGEEVGPDITVNGRSSYEQLLSNVFDPSLVIGAGYQPMIVVTTKGLVVTGLIVENGPQRIVLKTQGGKLETIPRDKIEESKISELSMMPEGIEKQLSPQELADLFAFITLDKPPENPEAKRLPGAPAPLRKP